VGAIGLEPMTCWL